MNVLIADDELLTLELLKNIIDWSHFGLSVQDTALNGKQAMNIISSKSIDILITDIKMPEMDGISLIKWVKEIKPTMKIIIISAYGEFEYAKKALALGVMGYLLKPIDEIELSELLIKTTEEIYEQKIIENNLKYKKAIEERLLNQIMHPTKDIEKQKLFMEYLDVSETYQAQMLIEEIFNDLALQNVDPDRIYWFCYELLLLAKQKYKTIVKDEALLPELQDVTMDKLKSFESLQILKSYMLSIVQKISKISNDTKRTDNNKLIIKAKEYIRQNYNTDITLEALCSCICVSKNYFCYLFKREVGESIWDYLTRYRIEKAKDLLVDTSLKNYEIAFEIGYENPSYFTKTFKKYTGLTPQEYRDLKYSEQTLNQ